MSEANQYIAEFLAAWAAGQRRFEHWDFDEEASMAGLQLEGVEFVNCFLFLDFRGANLRNAKFISCNMKTADFSGADLTNAWIKNSLVEATIFKDTRLEGFRFEDNYYFGATLQAEDFDKYLKD